MLWISRTPQQCEIERFTNLLMCYKCYALEAHITAKCTQTYIICSECGEMGHRHNDCTNDTKSCINCKKQNLDHNQRSLVNRSPIRKKAMDRKDDQIIKKKFAKDPHIAELARQTANKTAYFGKWGHKLQLNIDFSRELIAYQ